MSDMREDFYEADEPVEKIKAAFDSGLKQRTGDRPSLETTTYLAVAGYGLRPAAANTPNGERLSAGR